MNTYTKIEWHNTCDLADTLYQDGFRQWIYVDADPMLAAYTVAREQYKTHELRQVTKGARIVKEYYLAFLAPEYLLDAVTLLPLMDSAYIYTRDGNAARMDDITFEVEWQYSGCLALITLRFRAELITKTACCKNMTVV